MYDVSNVLMILFRKAVHCIGFVSIASAKKKKTPETAPPFKKKHKKQKKTPETAPPHKKTPATAPPSF